MPPVSALQALVAAPDLALEHLAARAELARLEGQSLLDETLRRLRWRLLASLLALLGLGLAGVALMLAVLAGPQPPAIQAVLLGVPLLPLLLAPLAWWIGRDRLAEPFVATRREAAADEAALRSLGTVQ